MKLQSRGAWIAATVAAYVLFLLITLPAAFITARLAKRGVISSATSGTVWHGEVTGLRVGVLNLGNVEWTFRFLPLFTGKLAADIKLLQAAGFANARVATTFAAHIILT